MTPKNQRRDDNNTLSAARRILSVGIFIFATVNFTACTSDRTSSLRSFGRWAENDTRTFWEDIKNAPSWVGNEFKRSGNDFYQTASFAVRTTASDAKETGRMLGGAPGYIASEASKDLKSLAYTTGDAAGWMRDDLRETGKNLVGGPGYIVNESGDRLRDLGAFSKEVYRKFKDDVRLFPAHIWETIQVLFIK